MRRCHFFLRRDSLSQPSVHRCYGLDGMAQQNGDFRRLKTCFEQHVQLHFFRFERQAKTVESLEKLRIVALDLLFQGLPFIGCNGSGPGRRAGLLVQGLDNGSAIQGLGDLFMPFLFGFDLDCKDGVLLFRKLKLFFYGGLLVQFLAGIVQLGFQLFNALSGFLDFLFACVQQLLHLLHTDFHQVGFPLGVLTIKHEQRPLQNSARKKFGGLQKN